MTKFSASCYGKLPLHGDFIRHNAHIPEIDQLDRWIQEGLYGAQQSLGADWEQAFDAMPPIRILFQPPQGPRVIAGLLVSSRDTPGRRFPFLIFATIDPGVVGEDIAALPFVFSEFLDKAESLAVNGWKNLDLNGLHEAVDGLAFEADIAGARTALGGYLLEQTNQSFWPTHFGPEESHKKYTLIQNMWDVLRPGAAPHYALRVPHTPGSKEVALWLEFVRRKTQRNALPIFTAWGQGRDKAPPGLTLVLDSMHVKYFLPICWPERDSDHLYPLVNDAPAVESRLKLAKDRFGSVLEDGGMQMSVVLQRLTSA